MAGFLHRSNNFSLDSYFERNAPDVICVFDPIAIGGVPFFFGHGKTIAREYATKHNIPLVGYYNTNYVAAIKFYPLFFRPLFQLLTIAMTRKYLRPFDAILLFSPYVRHTLSQMRITNTLVLPIEGLPIAEITRSAPDEQPVSDKPLTDDKPTIVFFGRIMREKNIAMMIRVFRKLKRKMPIFEC